MTLQDRIAEILRGTLPKGCDERVAALIAEAAEQHYRPRIETVEQLDALPVGSVVRCGFGVVHERRPGERVWTGIGLGDFGLPAVVLWSPGADE